jgi:16S rRNA (guanine1516-N2)-methyltransferase
VSRRRPPAPDPAPSFVLEQVEDRLQLRALHRPGYGPVYAEWSDAELRRRIAAGRRQPLARALGLQHAPLPTVLDATAGLGRDAFVLAALGAEVTLVERNPATAALLRDALRRAAADPALNAAAARMRLVEGDAQALPADPERWDAVYLDPMYPDDGRRALPSKEMQILRDLNGGDPDADALLTAALLLARKRVAVKRPAKAPPLADRTPNLSLHGSQLRFDVYLVG